MVAEKKRRTARVKARDIPAALVYERWGGTTYYYKNYEDVLAGTRTLEEIMSSSDLQAILVYLLNGWLFTHLNRKKYIAGTNESGLRLAKNDTMGNDTAVFEKEKIGKLQGKHFSVPPRLVIEVDIKAELQNLPGQEDYVFKKSQRLLDFGVEKVVWILTLSRKIMVATRNDPRWLVVDWTEDVPVLDDCVLNLKALLDEEGIAY